MKQYKTLLVVAMVALFILPGSAVSMTMDDINIHGFVSQGFLQTTKDVEFLVKESDRGSFEFNEMAVNFSASPTSDLTLGMQLYAYDLGENGNDDAIVDWAYGDYSFRDYLGVRAGIMKIPFGLYNETRDIDMVRTSILLPASVYPEWFRDAFARIKGVGLYGTLPGDITYQAVCGYVPIDEESGLTDGVATLLSDLGMAPYDTDTDNAYAGKLQWNSPFGLKLGASLYIVETLDIYMTSTLNLPAQITGLSGLTTPLNAVVVFEPIKTSVLSAEFTTDRLTLAAEYAEYDVDLTVNISSALDPALSGAMGIPSSINDKFTMQGYYGSIAYRILDQLEIGAYYSELYKDKSDHNGHEYITKYNKPYFNAWLKDKCLSARYDFSPNWCAKVEAHLMNGTYMAFNQSDREWALYAAKVTYNF